jgi:hypothetical protein
VLLHFTRHTDDVKKFVVEVLNFENTVTVLVKVIIEEVREFLIPVHWFFDGVHLFKNIKNIFFFSDFIA